MESLKKFNVGLVQMAAGPKPDENLERAGSLIHQAAVRGARIVCLPELFRSQYFCQREDPSLFELAEQIPGPTTEHLAAVARKASAVVIAPVFERRAPGLYHNSAVIMDADGTVAGIYRKMHIPDDPAYYEKYYFTPGDLGFRAFDTAVGRVGTLICWDQWYPEGARLTALKGAILLFYPTAIGWHPHEKQELGQSQMECLADHTTRPCNRKRRLRRCRQPGRPRNTRRRAARNRILGFIIRRRPVWCCHR
jgi:N-carbamoylputrescine amidase